MKKEQLAMVSALVGAGGNAGAVFAGFAFYKQDWDDSLTPFKLHAGFVISMAILSPFFYWPEYGSMFSAPAVPEIKSVEVSPQSTTSIKALVPAPTATV